MIDFQHLKIDHLKYPLNNQSKETAKEASFQYSADFHCGDSSPYVRRNTTKFAYAYVIGGCKPEKPAYQNFIYDVLISTYFQRKENSKADVIVFIQMSHSSSFNTLPENDLHLLRSMHIKILYIPKASDESFYRIMLDKFRILELTQYDRVLFLDSDVMTLGNLDYLFVLSMQGKLRENVGFAGKTEPMNGGTFLLTPQEGDYDRLINIIREKELRGSKLPFPHWDEVVGWGHAMNMEKGDCFEDLYFRKIALWNFHGAFADQGLVYHWVKYVKKSVSVIFRKDKVLHYGEDPDGIVRIQEIGDFGIFKNATLRDCFDSLKQREECIPPTSDYIHFTGSTKPWLLGPPIDLESNPRASGSHVWFTALQTIVQEYDLKIDLKNWKSRQRPLLKGFPTFASAAKTKYRNDV